jgi:hypothetical protein
MTTEGKRSLTSDEDRLIMESLRRSAELAPAPQAATREALELALLEIVRQAELSLREPILVNRGDTLRKIAAAGRASLSTQPSEKDK